MKMAQTIGFAAALVLLCGSASGQGRIGVATVEIKGKPADAPSPLAWLMASDADPTLPQLVGGIRGLADDDRVKACVIRLKDAELGFTQVQEIGLAIAELRDAGKTVHVFAEGYTNVELLLASYADETIVQRGGPVSLTGMYMEEMYLADTLSWVGLKAELIQVGDFKGANEQMTRSEPSPQWNENIEQLLDGLYGVLRSTLAKNRGLTDEQMDRAMASIWISDPAEQVESGLVDAAVDLVGIESHLEARHGGKIQWIDTSFAGAAQSVDMSNPFALFGLLSQEPDNSPDGPAIGVVHIAGPIVDGDSSYGGLFGEQSVGSRTIRNALEEARDEDLVKGVVLRIDSPGGSAIASEVIWQGVRRLAEKKPVWVSVGSMAASGGYYVAVAGDRIHMNDSSIVGSIGVVGGKISMGELYDTLRVRVVSRGRGPGADVFSSSKTWDEGTRAMVRAKMKETYDLFASRVETGRKGIDLAQTAEGRLFTGQRAVALGMADGIGSLDQTVEGLAESLGLDEFEVVDYPGQMSLDKYLEEALGGFVRAPRAQANTPLLLDAAKVVIGPRDWPIVRDALASLAQLRKEPVLLAMPRAITFR